MQSRARLVGVASQAGEHRRDCRIATLDEQTLRRVAPPSVGMREQRHQILGGAWSACGLVSRGVLSWTIAPDAAEAPRIRAGRCVSMYDFR